MADAIPVSGKKKAPLLPVDVEVVPVSDPIEKFPEPLREAARKAIAAGRTVTLTVKGNLKSS